MQLSGQRSVRGSSDVLLRQFGHRQLHVPPVVGYVAAGGVDFGVFKTVAAHLGVLVVDRVDEEEDDGDGDDCDSHESSDEGKVVLCQGNHKGNMLMF